MGGLRTCGGEPYDADYDSIFNAGKIRYLRHKVLFNMYNFDLENSRHLTKKLNLEDDESWRTKKPLVSLTLTDCTFKYFLDDYEALIYVETSIVERVDTLFSRPYLVQMGDDRGAIININNSDFKHSAFCKGLIVFREQPELLPYDNEYLVLNFAYEAQKR